MIKTMNTLEITRESGNYTLTLPISANLGELFDVLHQMKCFVFEKMDEIHKMEQMPKPPVETNPEDPKTSE